MVFLALFAGVLLVLSMLFCVVFNVGMRDVCVCWGVNSAGKGILKEEGNNRLASSSIWALAPLLVFCIQLLVRSKYMAAKR